MYLLRQQGSSRRKGMIIEVLQDYREQWFYVIRKVCVGEDFPTRFEAEEAAIIKALELL